jgi:hypothetical protein
MIVEAFHPRLLMYDDWRTRYLLAAAKIHLHNL